MSASRGRSVEEKVGDWKAAFDAIEPELQIPGMVELTQAMQSEEMMRDLPLYIQMARIVAANRRAAAVVAALATQTGIKPTSIDFGDDA